MNAVGEESFRHRVTLQYDDSRGFLVHLADNGADAIPTVENTRSVQNMLNAYDTINTFLSTQFGDDVQAVRRFYVYYTTMVKLVRIKTPSVAHALKVFETINDRGVGLDAMDLLKNLMFMNASPDTFDKLKDKWKELVDTLYKGHEKPLRFLRYFIFANYDVDRLKEDQIYDWFVRNEKLCDYVKHPIAFVERLHKADHAYTRFVEGKNANSSVNRYLVNIGCLSGAARQHLILLLAAASI